MAVRGLHCGAQLSLAAAHGSIGLRHGGGQHPALEGGFLTPGPPARSLGFRSDASRLVYGISC